MSAPCPRHVPARIVQVTDIPRTRSGKIVELAVRAVVHGEPVASVEALANPEALEQFKGGCSWEFRPTSTMYFCSVSNHSTGVTLGGLKTSGIGAMTGADPRVGPARITPPDEPVGNPGETGHARRRAGGALPGGLDPARAGDGVDAASIVAVADLRCEGGGTACSAA